MLGSFTDTVLLRPLSSEHLSASSMDPSIIMLLASLQASGLISSEQVKAMVAAASALAPRLATGCKCRTPKQVKTQKKPQTKQNTGDKGTSKKKTNTSDGRLLPVCGTCQGLHTTSGCQESRRCCVCAAGHESALCLQKLQAKKPVSRHCPNCGEDGHSAASYFC